MSSFVMDPYHHHQQWPQLITTQPPFPSPPPSEHGGYQYFDRDPARPAPTNSALSLNISSLSVTSPTNLSPIAQTNGPASTANLSPATPISPSNNPFNSQSQAQQGPQQQQQQPSPFQFDPHQGSSPGQQSPNTQYDEPQSGQQNQQQNQQQLAPPGSSAGFATDRRPTVSRSSSASTTASSQLPSRKRSFTTNPSAPSSTTIEENVFDESRGDTAMDLASTSTSAGYTEDLEMRNAYGSSTNGGTSPVEGSGNTSGAEDVLGTGPPGGGLGVPVSGSVNALGKPLATNNFVTKLYQMINDPKSSHFISWTELGTSFVVSNVGEFSRSILGAHFKHNNFSSFVRQLNMYGFHKINRTPRAQRTSTDAQTWEFSHHKFLRGRPDLLDEIKRKALEPDPAVKHRVELPGEVAAQLTAMRDENRRMADQLCTERKRVDTLVNVVGRLWDVMNKSFPGSVGPFPQELIEAESPNIYITSPTATTSRYPPPLSMNIANPSLHGMHSHAMNSPSSSPTAADFPAHHHQQQQHHQLHPHHTHTLSRQHSFQHLSYSRGDGSGSGTPGSPGSVSMDLMDDFDPHHRNNKRPRLSADVNGLDSGGTPGSGDSIHLMSTMSSPATSTAASSLAAAKKAVRARSDSAPLGYTNSYTTGGHGGLGPWGAGGGLGAGLGGQAGRPRSGSGLGLGMGPRIPNINNMTRSGGGTPMLSIATVGDGMGR